MRSNRRFIRTVPVLLGVGIVAAAGAAEPTIDARSKAVIAGDQDGRTYRFVVQDGEVSAVLDGQPLNAASIRREGRTYRLIGDDGQPLLVTMHPTGESRRLVPRPQTARVPAARMTTLSGAQFIAETTEGRGDRGASVQGTGPSVQIVANVTDGRRTTVRIENGRVVDAEVDGQTWPAERVRLEGGSVLLLDEDGTVAQRIDAGLAPRPQTARVVGAFNAPAPPAPPVPAEPPPVMLGITMSEPDETLRVHLRLPEKGGIVVDRVIEGLPAHRAGLRQHDVIVALNGNEGVTIEGMRTALRDREPGDTLRLRVISRGERREMELQLEAYEAEKLGLLELQAEIEIDLRVPGSISWPLGGMAPEQLKAQLQEALRGIEEAIPEEEIKQKLQDAIARLEQDVMQTIRIRRGDAGVGFMPDPEWIRRQVQDRVQDRVHRAVPERDDVRRRFEELESRLQRLEERLSEQLDRLHERLGNDERPR